MRRHTPAWIASLTLLVCCGLGIAADGARAQTLKAVKDRGTLVCGVSRGILGFSSPGADSTLTGFDVDFCRALAAAIVLQLSDNYFSEAVFMKTFLWLLIGIGIGLAERAKAAR